MSIETSKIINRKYNINPDEFFDIDRESRHSPFLKTWKIPKTNFRRHFFIHRAVPEWNKLPSDVKCEVKEVNAFKNKLDKFKGWNFSEV